MESGRENHGDTKACKSKVKCPRGHAYRRGIIALVLIVLICIFAANANSAQNEYAQARNAFGEDLYTKLYMFARSYDGVTLAGADVQGSILPSMRDYYIAATALDDAIVNAYGQRYQLLDATTREAIDEAFEAFDDAYARGDSTNAA